MSRRKFLSKPKRHSIEDEIALLRGLDLRGLHARWKLVFRKASPSHLPRHLLFGILAYQLQAEAFGDLDAEVKRILNKGVSSTSRPEVIAQFEVRDRDETSKEPGTVLMREWRGDQHRVMVMADGFAWNGKTYQSLSAVAFAMTGTQWSGPRFFGLRSKASRSQERPASSAAPSGGGTRQRAIR